jgi:hypothetical protein
MAIGAQLLAALLAGLFCALVWTLALGWQPRAFVAWTINGGVLAFIALHGPIVLG